MTKQDLRTNVIAAIALLTVATARSHAQSLAQVVITSQPADQLVFQGTEVTFSAGAILGSQFQWLRNGVPIVGQTNAALTILNAQNSDAGYYSCAILNLGAIAVTEQASLMVFDLTPGFDIVVYAQPIVSGGGRGSCPGTYKGYVNYIDAGGLGGGWTPSTNTSTYTATDYNRSDTKVQYVGLYGDAGCNKTTVTIPYPAYSPAYGFTIFFTNNVPTNSYPITLSGFNP